ncbi:alpha/beta hydrolase [Hyaloraphidium curvatum]|nr:alpha/beta hydrolase [Hyaloraphidium curvatum]
MSAVSSSALHSRVDREALPGLQAMLAMVGPKGFNGIADLQERRKAIGQVFSAIGVDESKVKVDVHRAPGFEKGDPEVEVRVLRPTRLPAEGNAGILFFHGGGMVLGTAKETDGGAAALADSVGAVVFNVEYRLAPEHPAPALVNDCFAGLKWASANASKFGVDNKRLAVYGGSAGGGLAAGTALMARDQKLDPPLAFQCLVYPMIDDRHVSPASQQIVDIGIWDREGNIEAWNWYLGRDASVDPLIQKVSIYAAPARASVEDLKGLPPAYIDVGDLDAFRDEDIEYAMKLHAAEIPTELHVWPGAYHAWEVFAPNSKSGSTTIRLRADALQRALGISA